MEVSRSQSSRGGQGRNQEQRRISQLLEPLLKLLNMPPWNPAKAEKSQEVPPSPELKCKPSAGSRAVSSGSKSELARQWHASCCWAAPWGPADTQHPGDPLTLSTPGCCIIKPEPSAETVSPMPGKVAAWECWARSSSPEGCKILSLPVCALFFLSVERRDELACSPLVPPREGWGSREPGTHAPHSVATSQHQHPLIYGILRVCSSRVETEYE